MGQASSLSRSVGTICHLSPSPGPGQGLLSPGQGSLSPEPSNGPVQDGTGARYQPTVTEVDSAKRLPLQKLLPKE